MSTTSTLTVREQLDQLQRRYNDLTASIWTEARDLEGAYSFSARDLMNALGLDVPAMEYAIDFDHIVDVVFSIPGSIGEGNPDDWDLGGIQDWLEAKMNFAPWEEHLMKVIDDGEFFDSDFTDEDVTGTDLEVEVTDFELEDEGDEDDDWNDAVLRVSLRLKVRVNMTANLEREDGTPDHYWVRDSVAWQLGSSQLTEWLAWPDQVSGPSLIEESVEVDEVEEN